MVLVSCVCGWGVCVCGFSELCVGVGGVCVSGFSELCVWVGCVCGWF